MLGKTIDELNINGINGTFYNVKNPTHKDTTWGIATYDNKSIDTNSYVSNYDGIKRGTIICDYDGSMEIKKIYNIKSEINYPVLWAISGIEMYPGYNPVDEGFFGATEDVLRKTNHTAIGFKNKNVYLITSTNLTLFDFRANILNSSIAFDGLINLDGGGSTQMNYKGKGIKSSRKLNHVIRLKEI